MSILNSKSKIVVVGLGKSGQSAWRLLREGLAHPYDLLKTFDEAPNQRADFSDPSNVLHFNPDFVVLSPGYPRSKPWVQSFLRQRGEAAVISELDLADMVVRTLGGSHKERVVGITGSAGKSTCSALLARALAAAAKEVFLGGNFGTPYSDYAFEVLKGRRLRAEFVVLELSSYQLESLKVDVEVGVITSFSQNHLDRYSSVDDYYATKALLWRRVLGALVLNSGSPDLVKWFLDPFYIDDKRLCWSTSRAWSGQKLLGRHNEQNLDVVAEVLDHLHAPPIAYESLLNFEGLEHRLENCGFHGGILFVNDSKATTIDSVLVAVEAMRNACVGTMHLLLGGKDKDLPWQNLSMLAQYSFIRPWFFGEVSEKAQSLSGLAGKNLFSIREFFETHRHELRAGDVVLLSPGGSSLDQYKNFEERGNDFKSLVNQYILV